jgi:asparagine synthase (glutamine-hydrolysing)
MIDRLRHRGPDSSGYYCDNYAVIGHARLAIIDLEGGSQPLSNETGSLWITYNGELYNYKELASELQSKGHSFRTKSDTEVVMHAFEEWDFNCFERFNGQWALSIWDNRSKKLVLSRDRLGIRPLYYTFLGKRLLFASEIKALFVEKKLERNIDIPGLAEILTYWSSIAPRTVFKDINELEPGHWLCVSDGKSTSKPYWTITFPVESYNHSTSIEENAEQLRSHLIEAVRLRFTRSDVPVGAYLSGGIDSSVTSAIINKYTSTPLSTYSIRFTDSEFDESAYQNEMVQKLGTTHNT